MFCTECGSQNSEESKFCKACGRSLLTEQKPPISEGGFSKRVCSIVLIGIVLLAIAMVLVISYLKGDDEPTDKKEKTEKETTLKNEDSVDTDILDDSRENYQNAEWYWQNQEYLIAREYYLMVSPEDSNYAEACDKAQKCYEEYVEIAKKQIEDYSNSGDYELALERCKYQEDYFEGDDISWLVIQQDSVTQKHITQIMDTAQLYLDIREVKLAEMCVNSGLEIYSNNEELLQLQSIIREYYPVYLGDAMLIHSDMNEERNLPHYSDSGPYYDTSGNKYENANYYWTSGIYSESNEVLFDTYDLNKEYTWFTATLAPRSAWKDLNSNEGTMFYVMGDDNVLFEAYIDKYVSPIEIELDITNVEELKVGMKGGSLVYIWLAEPYVYKQY